MRQPNRKRRARKPIWVYMCERDINKKNVNVREQEGKMETNWNRKVRIEKRNRDQ